MLKECASLNVLSLEYERNSGCTLSVYRTQSSINKAKDTSKKAMGRLELELPTADVDEETPLSSATTGFTAVRGSSNGMEVGSWLASVVGLLLGAELGAMRGDKLGATYTTKPHGYGEGGSNHDC